MHAENDSIYDGKKGLRNEPVIKGSDGKVQYWPIKNVIFETDRLWKDTCVINKGYNVRTSRGTLLFERL